MTTLLFCVFFISPALITAWNGEKCQATSTNVYTTTEVLASTQTVFVIDFTLKCSGQPKNMNLYAEMDGRTVLATKTAQDKYQVSFSDEHKNLPAKHYVVNFYDDEGYTDLRKAQRNNEATDSVKSLFKVDVNHPGASKGPWLQSEFIAASTAFIVVYLAHRARSKLQA